MIDKSLLENKVKGILFKIGLPIPLIREELEKLKKENRDYIPLQLPLDEPLYEPPEPKKEYKKDYKTGIDPDEEPTLVDFTI